MPIDYRKFNKKAYDVTGGHQFSMEHFYADPDMYYRLIEFGTRLKDGLSLECYKALKKTPKTTPDYGALLCVIGYNDKKVKLKWLIGEIESYCNQSFNNPHFTRWQISLNYLLYTLTKNETWLKKCLSYDFKKFSPMILIKQLEACNILAKRDKKYLSIGLELYKEALKTPPENIVGDKGFYTWISIKEFTKVSELATELALKHDRELKKSYHI